MQWLGSAVYWQDAVRSPLNGNRPYLNCPYEYVGYNDSHQSVITVNNTDVDDPVKLPILFNTTCKNYSKRQGNHRHNTDYDVWRKTCLFCHQQAGNNQLSLLDEHRCEDWVGESKQIYNRICARRLSSGTNYIVSIELNGSMV